MTELASTGRLHAAKPPTVRFVGNGGPCSGPGPRLRSPSRSSGRPPSRSGWRPRITRRLFPWGTGGGGSCAGCTGLLVGGGDRPPGPATERDDERSGEVGTVESVVVSSAARWGLVAQFPAPLKCRSAQTGQAFRGPGNCATSHDAAAAAARQPDPAPHDANGPAAERQRTDGPAPTHGAGPSRCSGVDQPARISRASFAVSVGVLPTLTPAASRASFFAAAVPEDPETMAPAWPIVLPSGAVKPAT